MRKVAIVLLTLVLMTGCEDSEFRIPLGAGSSGGGNTGCIPGWSCPKGYQPPPQTLPGSQAPGTAMAMKEQHGAVNAQNCYDMEARFKRAGRRVRLVSVRRNEIGSGGVLVWICEFEDDGSGEADSGYYEPQY